ncbi:MAG: tetratricopeptide repeat protein [Anaerolineales bacterium]
MVGPDFSNNLLTQAFAEHLVDEVFRLGREWIPKGVSEVKKRWPKRVPDFPDKQGLQVRRVGVVNRERELRAIRAALADTTRSHVLYFYGPGGMGKTRLLEETPRLIKSIHLFSPLRWARIIDLYHAEYHSIPAVQMAIVNALDPQERFFGEYRQVRQQFEHHKAVGLREELKSDLDRLDAAFREGYWELARTCRPVLAFDTFEKVNEEPDLIQRLGGGQPFSLEKWLVDFWQTAPNSVFLVASRLPVPISLQRAHNPGNAVEKIDVGGFTRTDSLRLLAAFLRNQAKPMQALLKNADVLWQAAQGSPVWLALAVELLARSGPLLAQMQNGEDGVSESHLVSAFFDYENSENRPVFLLALARKGLTADLLHYLEPPWTLEECKRRLDSLRELSLVKTRPGKAELFLHDALYELFDEYIPQSLELRPWYKTFMEYYQQQQAACQSDRAAWGDAAVKLLYYALQYDPCRAFYEHYIRWSEAAIAGYEIDLDMQLRDELLLFLRSKEKRSGVQPPNLDGAIVNLDSAVRWVKRYRIQAAHQKAAELAESLLSLSPNPYCDWVKVRPETLLSISTVDREQIRALLTKADDLFWGHLLTYYGDVLIYLVGTPEERISFFLDQAREHLQRSTPPPSLTWLQERLLGRVYDRFGYLTRTYGHYGKAVECYRQALPYLEKSESLEELATTLNNLAFVLAFLGETEKAKEYADKAIEHRQRLGQRFPLGLSYNTRGLIYASENHERAVRECRRALAIFEEINAPRGIGLACNALGYILRKQGQGKVEKGDCAGGEKCFQEAKKFLERSIEIFSKQVAEPIRLWEAYNELGSLYYDWGCSSSYQEDKKANLNKAVEQHLLSLDAFKENKPPFQEADTCEDLAKTCAMLGKMEEAAAWLDKSRSLVPDEYDFTKQGHAQFPPAGEGHWLSMGKIWLRKGAWALNTANDARTTENLREGVQHLMFSAACFYQFWPSAQTHNQWLEEIVLYIRLAGLTFQELQEMASGLENRYGLNLETLDEDAGCSLKTARHVKATKA